uniref:Uncharacterized protein n=1 Tax=Prymnesium polylepis TaxID=72548 RepID=A0A7S4HD82_9EUKA
MAPLRLCVLLALTCAAAVAETTAPGKPKRKWCNTTVHGFAGDYAYEACGSFCKEAKATNHCKFCKCRACSFCSSKGTPAGATSPASAAPAAVPMESGKGRGKGLLKKAKKLKKAKAEAAAASAAVEQTGASSKPKKLKKKKNKEAVA